MGGEETTGIKNRIEVIWASVARHGIICVINLKLDSITNSDSLERANGPGECTFSDQACCLHDRAGSHIGPTRFDASSAINESGTMQRGNDEANVNHQK